MTPPFINHFQSNLLMKSFFSVNQSYNVNLWGRKRAVQRRIPGLELFIENHYPNEIRAPLVSYFNRTLSYRVSTGYRLSIFIVYDQFIRNSSKPYTFAFQINIRMGGFQAYFWNQLSKGQNFKKAISSWLLLISMSRLLFQLLRLWHSKSSSRTNH